MNNFVISIIATLAIIFTGIIPKDVFSFFSVAGALGTEAFQWNPNDMDANFNVGASLFNQKRYDEAITIFKKILIVKPDHVDAYRALGLSLANKGNIEDSLTAFQDSLAALKKYQTLGGKAPDHANFIALVESAIKDFKAISPSAQADKVELYGNRRCPVCQEARNFFMKKGINFVDYDIDKDENARRRFRMMIKMMNVRSGVPLVVIYGQRLKGFNQEKYQTALNSKRGGLK